MVYLPAGPDDGLWTVFPGTDPVEANRPDGAVHRHRLRPDPDGPFPPGTFKHPVGDPDPRPGDNHTTHEPQHTSRADPVRDHPKVGALQQIRRAPIGSGVPSPMPVRWIRQSSPGRARFNGAEQQQCPHGSGRNEAPNGHGTTDGQWHQAAVPTPDPPSLPSAFTSERMSMAIPSCPRRSPSSRRESNRRVRPLIPQSR